MKSKKLSKEEINVISNEISKKVNEKNLLIIENRLIKNTNYLRLKKLFKERERLNKRNREVNNEITLLNSIIRDDFKININYMNDKVVINNNMFNNYYNDIVLMNIGSENNIDELMNKIVEKYIVN
jgi:hypothetical protein